MADGNLTSREEPSEPADRSALTVSRRQIPRILPPSPPSRHTETREAVRTHRIRFADRSPAEGARDPRARREITAHDGRVYRGDVLRVLNHDIFF